jgi:general secretion pathway protein E
MDDMRMRMTGFEVALLARDQLSPEDLAHARNVSAQSRIRLAQALLRLGLVGEDDIAAAFATARAAPRLEGSTAKPDIRAHHLNSRFLHRNAAALIDAEGDRPYVAMADIEDEKTRAALCFAVGADVEPVVATFSEIENLLRAPDDASPSGDVSVMGATDLERLQGDSDAPIIRLVQTLLSNAVLRRASDVHLEPMARQLIVRYRIDGRLVEVERHPLGIAEPIASRIKVMAALDIAETRLPQDGRLRITVRGRDIDVRVSTSPTAFGESIVLRLLGRGAVPLDLDQLGLPATALAKLARALDRPHGIILLTGPTGSGKTTTLYAALSRLRRPEVKILTVEDPVEILLDGVNQVQVRPEIGLSYADTLRAFLRQDPDILMIGEIRDRETAEIALRAALTGHLVLSTLHTNSTTGAFTRLADIGIEPYLSASTVIAVIAQRLIRTLCAECAVARPISSEEVGEFAKVDVDAPDTLHDPVGCPACQNSGYRGRMPLIEMLEMDAGLRDAVRDDTIDAMANPTIPSETLLGHGLALVATGRTTLTEVRRAVQAE